MEEYSRFQIRYELKKNEDTTQNLYAKSYQNSSLICETDFGNISYIVAYKKENDTLKQALNEIRESLLTKIKENKKIIEMLEGTGSFRIGNAQSKIKDYQECLEIIDKYLGGKE